MAATRAAMQVGREATQEAQVRAMGVERILAAMLVPPAALVIQVAVQGTSTAMGLEGQRRMRTRTRTLLMTCLEKGATAQAPPLLVVTCLLALSPVLEGDVVR